MSIFSPSFLLGSLVLLYLTSFVIFAILRVATGISIQRVGYFSLRRISYAPREGIRINIRGLGLHLHRPTFAQPTWISLRLEELKVTLDIEALASASRHQNHKQDSAQVARSASTSSSPKPILRGRSRQDESRSRAWKRLTGIKEKLKELHEKIHWFRLVDVFAVNSCLAVEHVGHFDIGVVIMLVDTRRRTVDRTRLFQHKKIPAGDQKPAEWMFTVRGVLFTPAGKESLEIVDIATLNIHGLLYQDLPGLRDTSVALKLGRVHVPYDDFMQCRQRVRSLKACATSYKVREEDESMEFRDMIDELDRPGSREANIVQTVSDSKEFVSSMLRGIQEIQLAVSFVGLSKSIEKAEPAKSPLYLNVSMNEFGLDLHRLDAKSPAHRMYFSPRDIAHQALIAAISISVSLDDGEERTERLLYVPMATATVKTTLPSKTVAFSEDKNTAEKNANILFANLVVTSPSIDLDPKHLPMILSVIRHQQERRQEAPREKIRSHHLLSRLLPKASIKMSVHEPVIRVKLPPADSKLQLTDDYDLLISMVSSISFEVESSHSDVGDLHYALASSLRLSSHQFYYQTVVGERHDLLLADAIELKAQITANPKICMVALASFQTLSIHMVRPEISSGVRQIVQQLSLKRHIRSPSHLQPSHPHDTDFLRPLPPWLVQFSFQGSNWSIDIAGIDSDVSATTRGIAVQLESWTAEYKLKRNVVHERAPSRRHMSKRSPALGEPAILVMAPADEILSASSNTDGRRLAFHVHGFEGFVMDARDDSEQESFLSLPRFEVAFTTSSDHEGPIFHINSYMKALYLHYSLYRFYAIGVATAVLRKAFAYDSRPSERQGNGTTRFDATQPEILNNMTPNNMTPKRGRPQLVSVDVRADLVQVKAKMPADPALMLQVFGVEAGQHRWAKPFLRSRLTRLYAAAPQLKTHWARMVSLKTLRVDLREIKRKRGNSFIQEKSYDVATEFIRIGVPHQLTMHKVFDNLVNVAKATEQLKYRFITGRDDFVLKKEPEKPRVVPRISIRSKVLLFDIEDGPFDWKLGMIYRVGLIEQKQRLAREEAFKAKAKRIEKLHRQGASRHRHPSTQNDRPENEQRSQSEGVRGRSHPSVSTLHHYSESPPRGGRSPGIRYDPEGRPTITEECKISIEEARRKLNKHNAQSWKKRIDAAYRCTSRGMREIRGIFWGSDEMPIDESSEKILAMPERPGLMSTLVTDLHIVLDKSSFPINDYPDFVHRVGKGMPRDTKYSLLIPMSVQIDMGEARVTLRDYPLPLLHVPAIRPGQSPRLPSWSLKTDFVIGEEYRGESSSKQIPIQIVPLGKSAHLRDGNGFAIYVRRTVSPVKTYSDVSVVVNTSAPTSITWGTSLQPAIQDMMMVIEGFTKPQVDPSDRVGFWDKIRLNVHSLVSVAWTGDGDVHLNLKGSRDPYVVTGYGAGFVMVWRKDVRWDIHRDEDPMKFMTVDSGEYLLAIPDFSRQAREYNNTSASTETDSISTSSSFKNSAHFKKTVMKLSGNVRWLAGLVFERNVDEGGRSFDFMPHYEVILKPPSAVRTAKDKVYDAFKGFRSNWIHLSLAIIAPLDRDWRTTNLKPSTYYNSVHLTPKFFTHFFDWWSLFSGVMSLPIRQGKLFPGIEKSSKKFGRHLATIKYNLLVSPLFITHMYKHKDMEEYLEDAVSATGLKLRLDSFMLDLHQRREEFTATGKGWARQIRTSAMKIHEAQLDFISADLRAISAKICGTTKDHIMHATDDELAALQEMATTVDLSRFYVPDNNFDWVDMDDFSELDWILSSSNPETKILPLAYSPRFTYFRQTDHPGSSASEQNRSSPFGNEPTHLCVMSQDNDPRKVQCDLIQQRLEKLEEQLKSHNRNLGEQELHVIRDSNKDQSHHERYRELHGEGQRLEEKKVFLQHMLSRLSFALQHNVPRNAATEDPHRDHFEKKDIPDGNPFAPALDREPFETSNSDFNNRFIVHNAQLKWNNSLRNIILRYVHQVSQRRGFIYYLTRRAVRFILDIVEEQHKKKAKQGEQDRTPTTASSTPSMARPEDENDDSGVRDRINELLSDGKRFVDADDERHSEEFEALGAAPMSEDVSEDFAPLNTYHVRLIAPQIQFQSEKNARSVLLLTTKSMQLFVIQIMDKDRIADEVSGLVQRRFSVDLDSAQFFVTNAKRMKQYTDTYLGNRYGAHQGSSWPPWVPFEVNFDFNYHPFGWSRVVSRTSASLRYVKYNTLRLKYNDEVSGWKGSHAHTAHSTESRIDRLWIEFPHIRAICDSAQYYTMYVIVLDLLLYSEPLEKVRSERLEKIMLASDFSDLRGAPEMVTNLQSRIRQLEEIKTHFHIHKNFLDRRGWLDNQAIEQDLANCEDELFFVMKAITTSQRKIDERAEPSQSSPLLRWYLTTSEIVWHLMHEKTEPLMEIKLNNALYDRTDNSDGSNHNKMEIERMHGLNLLPDAIYPEMLGPYVESGKRFLDGQDPKMLKVSWHMLEAIAGIPVLDQFEVDLFPLKVQLERDIGQKLFEYIFPGVNKRGKDAGGGFSPFMIKQTLEAGSDDEGPEDDSAMDPNQLPQLTVNGAKGDARVPPFTSQGVRLRATTKYPDKDGLTSSVVKANQKAPHGEKDRHFRFFQHPNASYRLQSPHHKPNVLEASQESLTLPQQSRTGSSTSLSIMSGSANDKTKRSGLHRSSSQATATFKKKNKDKDKAESTASDDLSLMLSRASNYMTLAYVKIPSVVLCLSYKGKGERNIQDVHDFVFRMPVLEYRNKTWSNLDLALRLKKDVIRALISHTGAIIGNKIAHPRPNKHQRTSLRDFALFPAFPPRSPYANDDTASSETSSLRDQRSSDPSYSISSYPRSELSRTNSFASSLRDHAMRRNYNEANSVTEESGAELNEDEGALKILRHNLTRRFTSETQKWKSKESQNGYSQQGKRPTSQGENRAEREDTEESNGKKSMLLLGKRILGGLNQQ